MSWPFLFLDLHICQHPSWQNILPIPSFPIASPLGLCRFIIHPICRSPKNLQKKNLPKVWLHTCHAPTHQNFPSLLIVQKKKQILFQALCDQVPNQLVYLMVPPSCRLHLNSSQNGLFAVSQIVLILFFHAVCSSQMFFIIGSLALQKSISPSRSILSTTFSMMALVLFCFFFNLHWFWSGKRSICLFLYVSIKKTPLIYI